MNDDFDRLRDSFDELKSLLHSLDNILCYCSNEYADVYYLYDFSKIIMKKTEYVDENLELVDFHMNSH